MAQRFDFGELRRQAGVMREQIPADVATRPDIPLNEYYEELQSRYAPEAVRTALWDLISGQTIEIQHPDNTLRVVEPTVS